MNYLAHALLSFNNPGLLAGNMISDFVKGKTRLFDYTPTIRQGILYHRAIDDFTDHHPVTKEAQTYLAPAVGRYSGAFVDIMYDHYLANDPQHFSDSSLYNFAEHVYDALQHRKNDFPLRFQHMLPHMQSQNWLYNYRFRWGIERSYNGITSRARFLPDATNVFDLFEQHYDTLERCYHLFFPDLLAFGQQYVQTIRETQ